MDGWHSQLRWYDWFLVPFVLPIVAFDWFWGKETLRLIVIGALILLYLVLAGLGGSEPLPRGYCPPPRAGIDFNC